MKKILLPLGGIFILIGILVVLWIISNQNPPESKVIVTQPSPTPDIKPATATLEIFTGTVRLLLPGTEEPQEAISGEPITVGTRIITGDNSRAQLLFPNKSVTRLDDNTEITLQKLTTDPVTIEILLSKRRVWSRVSKLLGNQTFQTITPTVIATVRGTSFGHGILPDGKNRVITTKGTVETRCINDSQHASITIDKKAIFDCATSETLPLLNLDEVMTDRDEWFEFNQAKDEELDTLFGAETYQDSNKP